MMRSFEANESAGLHDVQSWREVEIGEEVLSEERS